MSRAEAMYRLGALPPGEYSARVSMIDERDGKTVMTFEILEEGAARGRMSVHVPNAAPWIAKDTRVSVHVRPDMLKARIYAGGAAYADGVLGPEIDHPPLDDDGNRFYRVGIEMLVPIDSAEDSDPADDLDKATKRASEVVRAIENSAAPTSAEFYSPVVRHVEPHMPGNKW